jgi:DNA-binding transcriptional regulator GbsR (MarR family)
LISPDPLSTENVMDELSISRGNANMNLRSLLEWGVIYKNLVPGERREFFSPEKDIWELARIVAKERRKRELEPAMKILAQVNSLAHDGSEEVNELKKVTDDLMSFSKMANQMLDKMSQLEQNRLLRFMLSV